MSRRAVVWLVPILLTLHNAEEAIAFRSYLPKTPALLPAPMAAIADRLSYSTMLQVLIILTVLAYVLALAVEVRPHSRHLLWLLLAFQAAMGLNGITHLLSATFLFHGYAPGLVTALTLNVPFAVYCYSRSQREQWLSPTALRATIPAAFVLHGPVLLASLWLVAILTG